MRNNQKNLKNEIWHEIGLSKGGRVIYSISNMGRCKRVYTKTGLTIIDRGIKNRHTGYWMYHANLGYVHRLVAQYFVKNDNPDLWVEVDHIDSNRDNNKSSNLRFLDLATNRKRGHAQRLRTLNYRHTNRNGYILTGKKYDAETDTYQTKTWINGMACAKELGCSHVLVYLAALAPNDPAKRSARTAKGWRLSWEKKGAEI